MGLEGGQGAAVYVGLTILSLMGPTAFATPPKLHRSFETVFASLMNEAVAVPSVNATPCERILRREDDDEVTS
jgi:hypothetical protein